MKLKLKENQIKIIFNEILKENDVSNIKNYLKEIILSVAFLSKIKLTGINKKIAEDSLDNDTIIKNVSKILSDKRIEILSEKMESYGIKNPLNRILNNKRDIEYFINERLKEMGEVNNFKIFTEIE